MACVQKREVHFSVQSVCVCVCVGSAVMEPCSCTIVAGN